MLHRNQIEAILILNINDIFSLQDVSGTGKRDNPHKYLLYKPTFSQLFTFLASGFKELPPTGAMLLYISADGCLGNANKHTDDSK